MVLRRYPRVFGDANPAVLRNHGAIVAAAQQCHRAVGAASGALVGQLVLCDDDPHAHVPRGQQVLCEPVAEWHAEGGRAEAVRGEVTILFRPGQLVVGRVPAVRRGVVPPDQVPTFTPEGHVRVAVDGVHHRRLALRLSNDNSDRQKGGRQPRDGRRHSGRCVCVGGGE